MKKLNMISYIIVLIIITFSCNERKLNKPKKFIDKSTMINLIFDMKVAEKTKNITDKYKKKNQDYLSFVYEKYKIDSLQFKENNDYYTENLGLYREIYKAVQQRLNDSIVKYKKIKKNKDSLARLKKEEKRKNKLIKIQDRQNTKN